MQKNARLQRLLQRIYAAYVHAAFRTTRWERIGFESYEADIARGVPRVLCSWHSRIVYMPHARDWRDHPVHALASAHADARIASADLAARHVQLIEVPTSGASAATLRAAVQALKAGGSLMVPVDGPLGPREVAKPGALVMAGLAGVQVAPITYALRPAIRLHTWDGFILPLPFARGVMAVGDGFVPPARMDEATRDANCLRLAGLISKLTETCEARLRRKR